MSQRMKAAFCCHGFSTFVCLVFGVAYLLESEFMPYHADALEMQWSDLDPAVRVLFFSSMKLVGGAWLAIGLAMVVLLVIPFRQGLRWSFWAIPMIGLVSASSTLYATMHVAQNTPANPPWILVAMSMASLILGSVLSFRA